MGPFEAKIIRAYISEAAAKPPVEEDAVREGDNTVLVIEIEFGAAFPAVPVTVSATILDLATGTPVPFAPSATFPAAGGHQENTFPVPAGTFKGRANHVCEITACLSAPVNPAFPPDTSFATQLFLVTA